MNITHIERKYSSIEENEHTNKLYYITNYNKKRKILAPLQHSCDDDDDIYTLALIKENFLQTDIFEDTSGNVNRNLRNMIIYSIENIPEDFIKIEHDEYFIINSKNPDITYYNDDYTYDKKLNDLPFTIEKRIICSYKKLFSKFIFNEHNDNDDCAKIMIETITQGLDPLLIIRLLSLVNDFNNIAEPYDKKTYDCIEKMYILFYDFTYTDYYDINSEGFYYYRIMEYYRNNFNNGNDYL